MNVEDLLADCPAQPTCGLAADSIGPVPWSDNASSDAERGRGSTHREEWRRTISVQANAPAWDSAGKAQPGARSSVPRRYSSCFRSRRTESPSGSLEVLVRRAIAFAGQRASSAGPPIIPTAPAAVGPAVPGRMDQPLQVLKIAHAFLKLPSLRRYLAEDPDPTRQEVDQVMGGMFLTAP